MCQGNAFFGFYKYIFQKLILDSRYWRVFRSKHPFAKSFTHTFGKILSRFVQQMIIVMFHGDTDKPGIRRIVKLLPFRHLASIHRQVVVANHLPEHRMLRIIGLNDHFPLFILTSCPAAYLGHQLEAPFVCPEIRIGKHGIGIQYPDKAYVIKIQPFGNHLCSHKHVNASVLKIADDLLGGIARTRGIQIHTHYRRLGKEKSQFLFHLFGTKTFHQYFGIAAIGTTLGYAHRISAVMATQQVAVFMINKRYITVFALRYPVADIAFQPERKAAPVLKKDNLFFICQRFFYFIEQRLRKDRLHPLKAGFGLDIYKLNFGQLYSAITPVHFQQSKLPDCCIMIAFHRGCC